MTERPHGNANRTSLSAGLGADPVAETLARLAGQYASPIAEALRQPDHVDYLTFRAQAAGFVGSLLSNAIPNNPLHGSCVQAIEADPSLGPFHRDADGRGPFVTWEGSGGADDPVGLPIALINGAAAEVALNGLALTTDALQEAVISVVRRLRAVAVGEEVEVLRVVGYRGFAVPEGQMIELPWGTIRTAESARRIGPPSQFGFGYADQPTALLVTKSSGRMRIQRQGQIEPPQMDAELIAELSGRQRVAQELVPLTLLFATAGEDLIPAVPLWSTTILPWVSGKSWATFWRPAHFRQRTAPLTDHNIFEITRWGRIVAESYREELALAGRRIVSAATARATSRRCVGRQRDRVGNPRERYPGDDFPHDGSVGVLAGAGCHAEGSDASTFSESL